MHTYEVFGGSRDGELLNVPGDLGMDEDVELAIKRPFPSSSGSMYFGLRTEIYRRAPGSRLVYVGRPQPTPEPEGY